MSLAVAVAERNDVAFDLVAVNEDFGYAALYTLFIGVLDGELGTSERSDRSELLPGSRNARVDLQSVVSGSDSEDVLAEHALSGGSGTCEPGVSALAVVDACRAAEILGIDERFAAVVERIVLGADCRKCPIR